MYRRSNPRWTGFHLGWVLLLGLLVPTAVLAGNTHTEGGAVVEDLGVPEMDGVATIDIYWTGNTAERASTTVGTMLAGHWLQDVGFALAREWQVGDEHLAVLEYTTGAGTAAHAGYYGVSAKTLTSLDPDEFPAMTVRAIPAPVATAGAGFVDVAWTAPAEAAGPTPSIAGYDLYRSTDGISFTKVNAATIADTTYRDSGVAFGTTYYYALAFVYAGTPAYAGSATSGNSNAVTPLDTTPPDTPVLAAEPAFTPGTSNTLSWSDESASGATEYLAEASTDAAFTTIAASSGWQAGTTYDFTGLTDGQTYYYRVAARDAVQNTSAPSNVVSSRQDATPPSSNLLASTAYKTSSTVDLEWTASDSVSGVAGIELYYAKDGGSYTLYPGGPWTTSPIAFDASTTGGDGAYDFYTLAADAVGNAETAPETPDASFVLDTQPPATPALAALPAFAPGTTLDVAWDDQSASGATEYQVEAATDAAFTTIAASSGWQAATSFTFTGLADAQTYHYRVQSRDAAGNASAWSALASATQDASPPATAVDALPAATNALSFDIAWTGTDATSGLTAVSLVYSLDGGPAVQLGPFTTSPIAFTAPGEGTYTFYTLGTDAVGNAEAAPATPDAQIVVDATPPALPTLAALPAWTTTLDLPVSWSDESASGAAEYQAELSTDPAFATITATSPWQAATSFTFPGLTEAATYHVRVMARDAAGNATAFTTAQSTTIDATAPTSAVAALPAFTTDPAISIDWTGSDATSGLASVSLFYAVDGGPYQELGPYTTSPIAFTAPGDGTYAFYTRATDAAGNQEAAPAAPDAQTTLDTAAPDAPAIASLPAYTAGTSRTLTWNDTGAAAYQAEAATDAAFTTLVGQSGWISETTFTFLGLTDGQQYFYRTRARDAAGNTSANGPTVTSIQDATAPATAVDALPATTNVPALSIAWTGSDATSGIDQVRLFYSKDGGPFMEFGAFTTSPIAFDASTTGGDGTYAFYTLGRDAAGNEEAAPATPDASTRIDTAAPGAPTIAGMQPFMAGDTMMLTWSDESATGATEYLAEMATDAAFTTVAASSGWQAGTTHAFTGLADGTTYWFRVKARDAAANETGFSGVTSTTMDATAPTSQVAALPALANSMALSIEWSGSDATSGIAAVSLFYALDGGAYQELGPFTSSPIAFTAPADGDYTFYTVATDVVGNTEAAPAAPDAQITIDTQAPAQPVLAALPAFTAGTSRNVTWPAVGGATEYLAEAATDAAFTTLAASSGWQAGTTYDFTGLTDGTTYWFRVKARDAAGNETGFSSLETTTLDATPPASQVTALPATTNSTALSIEWTGSDATSGIAAVSLFYSLDGAPYQELGPYTTSPIAFTATADGEYEFYTVATDAVGNAEAAPVAPDAQILVDTAAPEIPVLAALPAFTAGTSLTLSWQAANGATEYLAEASTDAAFASIAASSGWQAATTYAFTGFAEGTPTYFRVRARDAAGNETSFSTAQATTFDAAPPSSQVSPLPLLTGSTPVDVAWTGFDIISGIAGVELYYSKDGAPFAAYPGGPFSSNPIAFDPAIAGGDGNYAFFTRALDGAGNLEGPPAAPDAQTRIDTSAPDAPVLAALPAYAPGSTVTLSWSDASASGAIEYLVEASTDAAFTTITAASTWIPSTSFVFNGLADGTTYYFRVKTRDAAHNESAYGAVESTTLDDTAPASQVEPLAATLTTQTFDIPWTGSDATSGVASVSLFYSVDGGAFQELGPFTSSPIAFTASTDGNYAFYTRARDNVGNREPAPGAPDASTIVSTAPVGIAVIAALPEFTAGTSRTITWQAANGATEYLAQAAEDANFTTVYGASGWTNATSWTFDGLNDGDTYYYRVRGRNAFGIEGDFSPTQVSTQDATPPISQVAPLASKGSQQSFDIVWAASDATSGVAGVELMVSRDGGPFTAYPGGPYTTSPIAFDAATMGGDGLFAFYTIATDNAGNVEAAPGTPDATTLIDTQAPTAPAMLSEPAFTTGNSNTVTWNPVADAAEYQVQCALDAMFTNVLSTSGWIAETFYTFTGLESGTTYYFRVRARDQALNTSAYSPAVWSTQARGRVLEPGWNLISFDVAPEDPSIDAVLSMIDGSYSIVRSYENGNFLTFLPTLPVDMNDLRQVDPRRGYWIYMTQTDTLAVGGSPIADDTPIALEAGWSLVSYLPDAPQSTSLALFSVNESLVLARGYDPQSGYSSWYPGLGALSDLDELQPGHGYWLYLDAADTLIYPSAGGMASLDEPGRRRTSRTTPPEIAKVTAGAAVPTVMDVWSREVRIDGETAAAGTILDVFDASGTLLASATVTEDGRLPILHLAGDIGVTDTDEGALEGEALTFKVRDRDVVWQGDEPLTWTRDGFTEVELAFTNAAALLPKAFALQPNYPNPFNPATTIDFAIPGTVDGKTLVTTPVTLRIYDIRGRVVRTLVDEPAAPGRYSVRWDGRDDGGRAVGSGVYFYRLTTDAFTKTRKMMMVK